VHELADELGVTTLQVMELCELAGVDAARDTSLDPDDAARVRHAAARPGRAPAEANASLVPAVSLVSAPVNPRRRARLALALAVTGLLVPACAVAAIVVAAGARRRASGDHLGLAAQLVAGGALAVWVLVAAVVVLTAPAQHRLDDLGRRPGPVQVSGA
jgi:hypothetical protein